MSVVAEQSMRFRVEQIDRLSVLSDQTKETPIGRELGSMVADLTRQVVREIPAVKLSVAAAVLDVTVPTVRKWIERGILQELDGKAVRHVETANLLAVAVAVRALRRMGQDRDFVGALATRVDSEMARRDPRALTSLQQVGGGFLKPASRRRRS